MREGMSCAAVRPRRGRGAVGPVARTTPHDGKPHKAHPKNPKCKVSYPFSTPSPHPLDLFLTAAYHPHMDRSAILHTRWSDRLAFDLALCLEGSGEPINDILSRHNLSPSDLMGFNADPVFLKRVESYREEIISKGMTFRLKARAQAEELLTTSWLLIHDPSVSPAVKADLIKSTVKWGGLEPKGDSGEAGSGGVRISINLGGQDLPMTIIDHDPARIPASASASGWALDES